MNAHDIHTIPLPMGTTLNTVELPSISRLAAYAIALSKRLREPIAHPRRISTVSYPPSARPLVNPGLPSYGCILPGHQFMFLEMHASPRICYLRNGAAYPLNFGGKVIYYVYQSPNNGASILLALLKQVGDDPDDLATYVTLRSP